VDFDVPAHHRRDLVEGHPIGGKPPVGVAKRRQQTEDGGARAKLTRNERVIHLVGARQSGVSAQKCQDAIEVIGDRCIRA